MGDQTVYGNENTTIGKLVCCDGIFWKGCSCERSVVTLVIHYRVCSRWYGFAGERGRTTPDYKVVLGKIGR